MNPIDASNDDDCRWLLAFVWPEAAEDRHLIEDALREVRSAAPEIVKGDAVESLAEIASKAPTGDALCLLHTNVLSYMTPKQRELLVRNVELISMGRETFWVGMEGRLDFSPTMFRRSTLPDGVSRIMLHCLSPRMPPRLLAIAEGSGSWLEWKLSRAARTRMERRAAI